MTQEYQVAIIDDDAAICERLPEFIKSEVSSDEIQLSFKSFNKYDDAAESLAKERFDLIILDLNLSNTPHANTSSDYEGNQIYTTLRTHPIHSDNFLHRHPRSRSRFMSAINSSSDER